MIRLLPLLLLASCNRLSKPDPNVRNLMAQIANVCTAYDNAAIIARAATFTGVQGQ